MVFLRSHTAYTMIFLFTFLTSHVKGSRKPHIIFILADDLGWNDVGFHGMTDIPTPNIDAMAADSLVLNNHYSASICTPSRASLLTGRYSFRLGIYDDILLNGEPWGLPLSFKLLPEYLNELGYQSHIVGKWHLGQHRRQFTPTYRGFQTHYGYWSGAVDYFTQEAIGFPYVEAISNNPSFINTEKTLLVGKDMVDQMKPVLNRRETYLTTLLTRRAKKIIQKHDQSKPLFLYLAHQAVHRGNLLKPLQGPKELTRRFSHIKNETKENFAGILSSLDESVGSIFEALESSGMLWNSIVVFVSDNGAGTKMHVAANGASNWPLRGEKGTPWEGAMRTVAMAWSPRLRNSPTVKDGLFHITDWMPTLYRLAGGNVIELGDIDGIDQLDFLKSKISSTRKEIFLMYRTNRNIVAFRNERYKLVDWKVKTQIPEWIDSDSRRQEKRASSNHWSSSKVGKVLRRFYEAQGRDTRHMKHPFIEISCARGAKEHNDFCAEKPMLFDLLEDPCETTNIAEGNPKVVQDILGRIEYWKTKSILPVKKLLDMKSDPKLHNGFWKPWLDETEPTHTNLEHCQRYEEDMFL